MENVFKNLTTGHFSCGRNNADKVTFNLPLFFQLENFCNSDGNWNTTNFTTVYMKYAYCDYTIISMNLHVSSWSKQFTENSTCHVCSSLKKPSSSCHLPFLPCKAWSSKEIILISQRRWKLSGKSHITLYPVEYKGLIKLYFSWQIKYLLMLINRNFIYFTGKYET